MIVAAIQFHSIPGNVPGNLQRHVGWVKRAIQSGASLILFPELSLTGYEPTLASSLALTSKELPNEFGVLSNDFRVTIVVGVPVRAQNGLNISAVIYSPYTSPKIYGKRYLHDDEKAFFVPGENLPPIELDAERIALAICYETSVDAHPESAINHRASLYAASVAKFESNIQKGLDRLRSIATTYSIPVIMANATGIADGQICAGKTSVWNAEGELSGQLGSAEEGMLLYDTKGGMTRVVHSNEFQDG